MLQILIILLPIFLTLAIGYAAVAFKLLTPEHIKIMGLFVIKIALPCLLITSLSSQDFSSLLQTPYLVSYSVASFVMFFGILLLYLKVFRESLSYSSVYALGASMSNTGFIGSAVLYLILGAKGTVYFAMSFLVENFVVFLVFLTCLEMGKSTESDVIKILKTSLLGIIKNPMVIALLIGFGCSVLQISLPQWLYQTLKPIGQTASPLGILVIGGSLYGIQVFSQSGIWRDLSLIFCCKILVFPALVYGIFLCFPSATEEMIFAGVLCASISMASMFGVFGQQVGVAKAPPILLVTTLGSIVSMTAVIHWLQPVS